ncbi:MAG: sulfite exporter TauE/SafE family protein [Proteobacteria bacterium]|nr:sulfite exporter TauE/SafE family protein [Pseudomonadota bacterium]
MEQLISRFDIYLYSSPFVALLISFVAGILTSFTPCVYPLIPLTVGFIGAKASASKNLVYAALGAFAALSGKLFGQISTSPWTYLFVGNLCFLFGLAMLDVFTLQVRFLANVQPAVKQSGGGLAAFIFGGCSGLVAGPCTTPVLGTLLAYVATKQNVVLGCAMLFIFALGMGTLLIVVGTFAGMLSALPKSGLWIERLKKGFGFLMIIVGELFIFKAGQLMI